MEGEREVQLVSLDDPSYSRSKTVLADPNNFTIKHPLQHGWTLWYDNPGKRTSQQSWGDHLKEVVTFNTVEDFWRTFNNIRPASQLASGSDYHLFKEGIEPKWEHEANAKGGKWVFVVPKQRLDMLDKLWLWAVLACIGESFDQEEEICGIVISVRKGNLARLALWTRTASNKDVQESIGMVFKRVLELPEGKNIVYNWHSDSLKKNSSFGTVTQYEL